MLDLFIGIQWILFLVFGWLMVTQRYLWATIVFFIMLALFIGAFIIVKKPQRR